VLELLSTEAAYENELYLDKRHGKGNETSLLSFLFTGEWGENRVYGKGVLLLPAPWSFRHKTWISIDNGWTTTRTIELTRELFVCSSRSSPLPSLLDDGSRIHDHFPEDWVIPTSDRPTQFVV